MNRVWPVIRSPRSGAAELLSNPPSLSQLLVTYVLPLVLIRTIAVLLRATFAGVWQVGLVLSLAHAGLQLSVWLGLWAGLIALTEQLRQPVSARTTASLAALMCTPLWLAGSLFLSPEAPTWLFLGSRVLITAISLSGIVLGWAALESSDVLRPHRTLLALLAGGSGVLLYAVLYLIFGLSTTLLFFVLGLR